MTILRYLILLMLISTTAVMAGDSPTAKELLKSKIDAVIIVLQNKKLDTQTDFGQKALAGYS
jgi:hypothetical protein